MGSPSYAYYMKRCFGAGGSNVECSRFEKLKLCGKSEYSKLEKDVKQDGHMPYFPNVFAGKTRRHSCVGRDDKPDHRPAPGKAGDVVSPSKAPWT